MSEGAGTVAVETLFDVSDARTAISVDGPRVGVQIAKLDETPSFTVFVPRSYAAHLRSWLKSDAA
jgi:sarcosine oxidase gamma subunit